jgi:hypothetical protein
MPNNIQVPIYQKWQEMVGEVEEGKTIENLEGRFEE